MSREIENKTSAISKDKKPLREKEIYFGSKDEIWDGSNTLKFSEIAHGFEYGVSAEATKFDGCNQYIRITDITETGSFNKNKLSSPSKGIEDKYLVHENDILLARTGASVGKSYLYNKNDGKLYFAGFLIRMNVTGLNSYYMKAFLDTSKYWNQVNVLSVRSGQPGLNAKEYKNFKMPYVSKHKSNIIGKFLSQIDNLIGNTNLNISTKSKLFNVINTYIFNLNDYGEIKELEKIASIVKGTQLNKINMVADGKYKVINGGICHSGYTNEYMYTKAITISEGGNSCGFVNYYLEPIWVGGHCFVVEGNNDIVNEQYLYYFLKYNEKTIMNLRVGSGLPNIQKKDLSKLSIFIPSTKNQNKFANILSQMDKLIEIEEKKLEKLNLMKKYYLQQFFD